MYDLLPIWVIATLVGALLFATSESAWFFAQKGETRPAEAPFEVALAPAFTLVALLLGFVFSMALGRFDARGGAVLREANAIREVAVLTDLLEAQSALAMRRHLGDYLEARLAFALADADPGGRLQAARNSSKIQADMRRLAVATASRNPEAGGQMVSALTNMTSASAEEAAALSNYIPPAIILMLVIIGVIASALMGFQLGCRGQRGTLAGAMLAIMLALILGTVIDLDQPQRGFIRVSLEPLRDVQGSIQP